MIITLILCLSVLVSLLFVNSRIIWVIGMPSLLIISIFNTIHCLTSDFVTYNYGKVIEIGPIRFIFVILSLLITLIILLVNSQQSLTYVVLQCILLYVLLIIFILKNIIIFYIIFEFSLIPISALVLGWGYQPERVNAGAYIITYTVRSSIPMLAMIVMLISRSRVLSFVQCIELANHLNIYSFIENIIVIFYLLGFLVKFPIYGFHLWLPKAHVEAPIEGSIILAGLLLKLGGFGILLFLPMIKNSIITVFLISFSLCGGALIRILCLRILDIKIIIAYSSVAHIALGIARILTHRKIIISVSVLIMLSHGISRPAIFLGSYYIYKWTSSRNMILNSAILSYNHMFRLWWFIFCIGNIAAPPTFNFLRELIGVIGIVNVSMYFSVQIRLLIFLGGAYTLILYSSTQHGQMNKLQLEFNYISCKDHILLSILAYIVLFLFIIISHIILYYKTF